MGLDDMILVFWMLRFKTPLSAPCCPLIQPEPGCGHAEAGSARVPPKVGAQTQLHGPLPGDFLCPVCFLPWDWTRGSTHLPRPGSRALGRELSTRVGQGLVSLQLQGQGPQTCCPHRRHHPCSGWVGHAVCMESVVRVPWGVGFISRAIHPPLKWLSN